MKLGRTTYRELSSQVSKGISLFVGFLLLAIGVSGSLGVFLQPIAEISFLIEPMGFGPYYDQLYWKMLTVVGIWLILFFWARLAAISAIWLIAFKWAVLQDLISF